MDDFSFEWNEKKNRSNQKKHGIYFDEAMTVFSDELGRLIPDHHSEGENRFILMGMSVQARILIVCNCERNLDTIRIISARKADKSERKQYEDYSHA